MSTADTQQVPKARGSAGQPGGRTVLLVTISLDTICVTGIGNNLVDTICVTGNNLAKYNLC